MAGYALVVPQQHIMIGMVFHEDEESITLKIPKDMSQSIELGQAEEKDQFYTVLFVKATQNKRGMHTWLPWLHRKDEHK